MGRFGGSHKDKHDPVIVCSSMGAASDLADTTYPGHFEYLISQIYVPMGGVCQAQFNGLLDHGGSNPVTPPGVKPEPWETRFSFVMYQSHNVIEPDVLGIIEPFGSLPNGEVVSLSPEINMPRYISPIIICLSTNIQFFSIEWRAIVASQQHP